MQHVSASRAACCILGVLFIMSGCTTLVHARQAGPSAEAKAQIESATSAKAHALRRSAEEIARWNDRTTPRRMLETFFFAILSYDLCKVMGAGGSTRIRSLAFRRCSTGSRPRTRRARTGTRSSVRRVDLPVNVYFTVATSAEELAARDELNREILEQAARFGVQVSPPSQTLLLSHSAESSGAILPPKRPISHKRPANTGNGEPVMVRLDA